MDGNIDGLPGESVYILLFLIVLIRTNHIYSAKVGKNSTLQDQTAYIKVDLKHIQIHPSNEFINSTRENKLAFLFRYTSHLISISLNNMEFEITIPLNQIVEMKITKEQEIAIELEQNFKKSVQLLKYYHYSKGNGNPPIITISSDPTNGKLNDAAYILFKPMHWVENNTLLMVEAGIQRLRFNLVRGNDDGFPGSSNVLINSSGNLADSQTQPQVLQPQVMDMDLLSFTEDESGVLYTEVNNDTMVHDNEVTELYITCVFLTERRAILFSQEGSFNQFIEYVRQRFGSSFNNISYKNKVNEMISLKDDEDWDVAKWEAEMEGTIRLNVYMG
ncbi:15078_t:CDS:2 [Racocetra fulgida]|uniref:15078_t:CDS:1 n=1 Tax=Racocetra fulgida TaxID=60492 RepID=A0A9N9F986_9GLOM|nr:15078_t:CDS:2 [Racocetra fulgida]